MDHRDLLLKITRDMARVWDLDRLLQMIVDAALRIVPSATKCVIHLLAPDGDVLVARVCSTPSPLHQQATGIPADKGIAGRALRLRSVVRVGNVEQDPDFVALDSGPDLRSLLVAPLCVGDIPLGTLSLSSDQVDAFSGEEQEYTCTLAAQAAVAIQQANLMVEAITERERSDAIIESISEGLVILNSERRIVRVNAALCRMLGITADDLSLPREIGESKLFQLLLDPSAGTIVGPYEVELPLPNGGIATFRVTASGLKPPGSGEVYVVQDATADRMTAEARSLFISQMSHELRTPLQHILGFISLITDVGDLAGSDYRRFLSHIEDETHHLARLVDDLVELSRIETGRFSIYMERVRLDDLVVQITNRLASRAHLKGLKLKTTPSPEPIWCLTDPLRVEQVLTNLVENACKYAPSNSTVRIALTCDSADATVQVHDNGPGIPREKMPHIFAAFYQVDRGTRSPGMGLGLYISQEIIRALGGDIWAESKEGVGSIFSFRLPRLSE
ncbi:MAG TPA: GAF domain-containing protein [Chloroflexi bacterium]|nr:GAF domain-containing protein [Chloroflexota bacterium]